MGRYIAEIMKMLKRRGERIGFDPTEEEKPHRSFDKPSRSSE